MFIIVKPDSTKKLLFATHYKTTELKQQYLSKVIFHENITSEVNYTNVNDIILFVKNHLAINKSITLEIVYFAGKKRETEKYVINLCKYINKDGILKYYMGTNCGDKNSYQNEIRFYQVISKRLELDRMVYSVKHKRRRNLSDKVTDIIREHVQE